MESLLINVYWLTFLLCLSSYVFYPVAVGIVGRFFALAVQKEDWEPEVSLLISAYNEERDIVKKIATSLALDYPAEKLEILIGSDGSTDNTVAMADKYSSEQVRLLAHYSESHGNQSRSVCHCHETPRRLPPDSARRRP